MSYLWLLLSKITKLSLRQPVSKSNFTRISKPNNPQKRLVKVWNSMQRVSLTRFVVCLSNAYFEKDNKVSARGSKGDFIFRECDENGVEIISIMFEMKNEADGTEKKHKNADFIRNWTRTVGRRTVSMPFW